MDDDIQINEGADFKAPSMKDINLDEILEKHPVEEVKEEVKAEAEEVKEEVEEVKEDAKETKVEDSADKEAKDLEEAEKEIEGYYADESLEDVETPPEVTNPTEELGKYILDNLKPITVTGETGGRRVTLNVKLADQLPDDFQFESAVAAAKFNQSTAAQAISAKDLADKYLANQQNIQTQQYQAQERRDIAADIAKLQRAGELQTFTPGVSVEEDKRAETAREVLKFYEAENAKRLAEANGNQRLYHNLSYEDAYYLWKARNNKVSPAQKAEDQERKEITKRSAKAGIGTDAGVRKHVDLPFNASWDQVINESLKTY